MNPPWRGALDSQVLMVSLFTIASLWDVSHYLAHGLINPFCDSPQDSMLHTVEVSTTTLHHWINRRYYHGKPIASSNHLQTWEPLIEHKHCYPCSDGSEEQVPPLKCLDIEWNICQEGSDSGQGGWLLSKMSNRWCFRQFQWLST